MLIKNINTTTRFSIADLLCQLNLPTLNDGLLRIYKHCSYKKYAYKKHKYHYSIQHGRLTLSTELADI